MLHIVIAPSKQLVWLTGLLYVVIGAIAWFYLPIPYHLKNIAGLLHGIHFYTTWYYSLSLRCKEAIVYLEYTQDKKWLLANRDGELSEGSLQQGSVCTYQVTALHFRLIPDGAHRYIWLFPDSVSKDDARRLRQILWWDI